MKSAVGCVALAAKYIVVLERLSASTTHPTVSCGITYAVFLMPNSLSPSTEPASVDRRALLLTGGAILCLGLALWMVSAHFAGQSTPAEQDGARMAFEELTGIRIVRVTLTAGGGLADIHYQVLDPTKALVVHNRTRPPTLVHSKSGLQLNRPFHGHGFRRLEAGVVYRLHIWNTNGVLKRGDRVTVVVGEASLEQVLMQ